MANVNVKDDDGQTAMLSAANTVVVKLLLKQNSVDRDSKDKGNRTPLSFATEKGNEMVARLLLERNAEVEVKDRNSRTPLLWAVENGYKLVAELLC